MPEPVTRVDRWLDWFKNNPFWAVLIVSGAGLIALGAVTTALRSVLDLWGPRTEANLEVVEASVNDVRQDSFPLLDVKLRNVGGQVAFVSKAEFDVLSVYNFESPASWSETHVDISWTYNVSLRLTEAPYTVSAPLSQAIRHDDVDRFEIVMAYDELRAETVSDSLVHVIALQGLETGETLDTTEIMQSIDKIPLNFIVGKVIEDSRQFSIIIMTVTFVYNRNKTVKTGRMMFVMPKAPHYLMATEDPKPNAREIVSRNTAQLKDITGPFTGWMSPRVKELLADVAH